MADKRKYADRKEELIRAVAKRRRKIKTLAIEYKGGKCQVCGYDKYPGALDLHHMDYKDKDFGIADKGYTRSWEKVKAELDKCVLVCANCHREIEAGITQLPRAIGVEKRGELLEA
jgi:5-methylcytosine-specific restriction endonuclease McrA